MGADQHLNSALGLGRSGSDDAAVIVRDPAASAASKDLDHAEGNYDIDALLHRNNAEIRKYPDWSKGHDESVGHFLYRLATDGHTFFDAWLLAAGCIGQIMMTTPNAWYKTGLIPGAIVIVWSTIVGFWTMWQIKALYYDRKRNMINQGTWFDDPDKPYARRHKTQMPELLGYYLGPIGGRIVVLMMFFTWFGLGVAQILASSTNYYAIDQSRSLRTYTIAFGASLLPFGFIPSFRKMRLILIFGVGGTMFTGGYGIWVAAHKGFAEAPNARLWPANTGFSSFQTFFNGLAIIFAILDHHYYKSYALGFIPLFWMIVPAGILLNLAFATSGIATAGNWFQLAPAGTGKYIAAWLMIIHNIQAWVLWMTAFGFMFEKFVGTHEKALWLRLLSRLPYLLAVYLFAVCFPFYSAINSLMVGLTSPLIYYTVPIIAFTLHYRTQETRDKAAYPLARTIFNKLGYRKVFALNLLLATYGVILVAGTSSMAVLNLVKLSNTFGFFPECYGCKACAPAKPK